MRRLLALAVAALAALGAPAAAQAVEGSPIAIARVTGVFTPDFLKHTVAVWDGSGRSLDLFKADFTADDALAMGDVLGADGIDEVLVAGDETGSIDIFDPTGISVGSFGSTFTVDDGFAVGDVNGFVGDEVVVAGDVTGVVDVYSGTGQLLSSFQGNFTPGDALALGDVNGDGVDEILIAGDGSGVLDIFNLNGQAALPSFNVVFTPDDGLAAGDVDGNGVDEVIVGGDSSHVVDIFDAVTQQKIASWNGDFTVNDFIAAGDVLPEFTGEEIIVLGDVTGTVDVFSGGGQKRKSFGVYLIPGDSARGFAVGPNSYPDQDRDGLLDGWEANGVVIDGLFIDLPAMGADPLHKDLFLELDWDGANDAPTQSAIQQLKAAFAAGPVWAGGVDNPDGQPGITLHVDTGSLTDSTGIEAPAAGAGSCGNALDDDADGLVDAADPNCLVGDDFGGGTSVNDLGVCGVDDSNFYVVKALNFDERRRWIFRYAISGSGSGCNTGGQGELGGNDFIDFNHDAGTLMHELGHNLGLGHGGHSDFNCKPNYVSVMNYDHQFGIPQTDGTTVLSYSPAPTASGVQNVPLASIDEDSLSESIVFDPADSLNMIVYVNAAGMKVQRPANLWIDWDGDGTQDGGTVQVNVDTSGLNGRPAACTNSDNDDTLHGSEDWSRIVLNLRQFGDSADGALNVFPEDLPTLDELLDLQQELNTTDLIASIADTPDPAVAGETLTYTVTTMNDGPNPANDARAVLELPAGVSYQSASPGCGPSPMGVICDLGVLPAYASATRSVTVLVDADLVYLNGGPKTITATATADNEGWPDLDAGNDSASEDTLVLAEADLEVVSLAPVDPPADVLIGQPVPLTLRSVVTSHGPSSPMDTVVETTAAAPAGGEVTPATAANQEQALAKSELRTSDEPFTLVCHAPGPHTFSFASSIEPAHAADTDPNSANNTSSVDVTVDCVVPVKIEIAPPPINSASQGVVALDVLTTEAGEFDLPLAFDATTILPLTVRFGRESVVWLQTGGSAEAHEQGHAHRASDGDTDLLMHFPVPGSALQPGDSKACVKGQFTSGPNTFKFFGCDAVEVR